MRLVLPCCCIALLASLCACRKSSTSSPVHYPLDTVFIQFYQNDTLVTWTNVFNTSPDSPHDPIAEIQHPTVSITPGYYLNAESPRTASGFQTYDGIVMQVNLSASTTLAPGVYTYTYPQYTPPSGGAVFHGQGVKALDSDTITVTGITIGTAQQRFISGTFSATYARDTLYPPQHLLHITNGVFRNVPVTE